MEQLFARIRVDEDGRCTVLEKRGSWPSPGDYQVRVLVESRSPETNVMPDPEDPWDKWPDHIFLD
jgi:hypothetical protein